MPLHNYFVDEHGVINGRGMLIYMGICAIGMILCGIGALFFGAIMGGCDTAKPVSSAEEQVVQTQEPVYPKMTSYLFMQNFCRDVRAGSDFVALLDPPNDIAPRWVNQAICASARDIFLVTQTDDGVETNFSTVVSAGDDGAILFPRPGSNVKLDDKLQCPEGGDALVALSTLHWRYLTPTGVGDITIAGGTVLCRVGNELVFVTDSGTPLIWSSTFMGSGLEHIKYDSIMTRL